MINYLFVICKHNLVNTFLGFQVPTYIFESLIMIFNLFVIFLMVILLQTVISSNEIEWVVANANKNGFSETLLLDVIKVDQKTSKANIMKQLESPKVQEKLISAALKYATVNVNDAAKKNIDMERSSWRDYCSYSWVRWLSFMNCKTDPSTAELDREEHHSFQIMKEYGKCYKQSSSSDLDYW